MKNAAIIAGLCVSLMLGGCGAPSAIQPDASASLPSVAGMSWKSFTVPKGGLEPEGFTLEYPAGWDVTNDDGDGIVYVQRGGSEGFARIQIDYCGERCGAVPSCAAPQTVPGTSWIFCEVSPTESTMQTQSGGRVWMLSLSAETENGMPQLVAIAQRVASSLKKL